MTGLGNRVFTEIPKLAGNQWGWELIKFDQLPYEKGTFGHRDRHRGKTTR